MVFAGSERRGAVAVVAVEIHTTLSALPLFMFVHFGKRRKEKNPGTGKVRGEGCQLEVELGEEGM